MIAMQVAIMKGRGGVLTSILHYARMWESVGVASLCLYRGPARQFLHEHGINVIEAPAGLTSPLFPFIGRIADLRNEIVNTVGGRPDCVMVHSDLALRNVRRLFPETVAMTRCHTDKTKHKKCADIVITLNPDQHKDVTRKLIGTRAQTYMLGHPFVPSQEAELSKSGNNIRINYVARFVPEKDPLTFVRAISLLKSRPLPDIRLIGDGPLRSQAEQVLREASIDGEFTGWRSEPLKDFTRKDVLVLPSTWEGLPWLLLEAQSKCIPIIASNISGNNLALGNGVYGDIFRAGDAKSLAQCLDTAIASTETLREKAEKGRNELAKRFGPDVFWNKLLSAIHKVKKMRQLSDD